MSTDARRARIFLALLVCIYLWFLVLYVPRLTNYVLGDREFSGWVGPIAQRLARGERPYVDFVLPIPPGSFLLLSAIQRVFGTALLLQELWVAALSHLGMGLIAYATARCFSARKVALLVALTTLVIVTQTPKQCVYDHTSLVVAWLSVLAASRALTTKDERGARRLFASGGFACAASLGFKQSTAVGMGAGFVGAFAYLILVEAWHGRRDGVRRRAREAALFGVGAVLGLAAVLGLLAVVRAPLPAAFQAVMRDGPALKGGLRALLGNLLTFTAQNDAIRATILPTAAVAAVALGVAKRHGSLHVGDESSSRETVDRGTLTLLAGSLALSYGGAIALLGLEVRELPRVLSAGVDGLRNVPAYGFVFGAAFFFAHLTERYAETRESRDRGHALNAILLTTVTASMIYDTSFVTFYPFYYNEPTIPVALLCLYVATERCGFRWATPLALALSILPTYGIELNRALSTDTWVQGGFWTGLRVNYRGVEVLKAAARAQELAGPSGTVLVLPEDVELAGLIQRPRPPLRGAVVFVDQYPKRLLAEDLAALDRNLPDVIVIHPRRASEWRRVFHTWSYDSAAEQLVDHVLLHVLPEHYTLEDSFPTIYFWDQGQIDLYLRKDQVTP